MFIQNFVHKSQRSPTLREIGAHFDIAPGTAQDQIKVLEKKGYLKRQEFSARGMQVPSSPNRIPIVGRVQAGNPHTPFENVEGHVSYESHRSHADLFALKVRGDSMIDAGIQEGDIAIVRKQATANSGDIVVALVDDEATIKYFRSRGSDHYLEPANAKYKSIRNKSITVIGKIIEVRRQYE